ncbi:MAG: hypothetical protein ACRDPC_20930 [Solirubrobacteraceae bacterium]
MNHPETAGRREGDPGHCARRRPVKAAARVMTRRRVARQPSEEP